MTTVIPPRLLTWTGATFEVRRPVRADDMPWRPCPTCWGAGRIWALNLIDFWDCPTCLGVASVPSVGGVA